LEITGSSPRMWGTQKWLLILPTLKRFIPTHVGNTRTGRILPKLRSVHPHACGEHRFLRYEIRTKYGSSPRMWGTLMLMIQRLFLIRFIPTHVGNTLHRATAIILSPVHPHACGEHSPILFKSLFIAGSSPRMWGTPHNSQIDYWISRFIPTHVGNTLLLLC